MAFMLSHITFFITILSSSITAERLTNLVVTNSNWDQMLEGEWMIKFYAPWCPACRAMEDTWNAFADWANQHKVKVGSVDIANQPALNGRFIITSLPTIYHVLNGEFRQYSSSRGLEDFKAFINKQEWREISPVSSWISPTSILMSFVSNLFSFAMEFKGLPTSLSSDYGLPTWLSMLLFGLLIITVGVLLGVVFIFATEYMWGSPTCYGDVIDKSNISGKESLNEDIVVTENNGSCENSKSKNSEEAEKGNEENSTNIRQRTLKTDDID